MQVKTEIECKPVFGFSTPANETVLPFWDVAGVPGAGQCGAMQSDPR